MNEVSPVTILHEARLIGDRTYDAVRLFLAEHGGSHLNAIASQPGLDLDPLWTSLSALQQRHYLPTPAAASPLDGTILSRTQATEFMVLGRKIEFQTVVLLTPDPLLSAGALSELRDELGAQVPGQRARLTLEVCTPATWKALFDYTYPATRFTPALSQREAMALASLTPARELSGDLEGMLLGGNITHEQYAEAVARQLNLPYVNAALDPPDPAALDFISPNVARATGLYPYRLTRDQRVIVLSTAGHDQGALQRLRRLTRPDLGVVWALVSPKTHERLMNALEHHPVPA